MNTLRLLCALLMTLSGAAAGYSRTLAQRQRLRLLSDIDAVLAQMGEEIAALDRPLGDLFARLAKEADEPLRPFLERLSHGTGRTPMRTLWTEAVRDLLPDREAGEILLPLAAVLGRYDSARQSAEIALTRSRLERLRQSLQQEQANRGRLYPGLGACLGGMLAVILF